MKQAVVDRLATDTYYAYYKDHASDPDVKLAVAAIAQEEQARGLSPSDLRMGVRTRIHEHLQNIISVVDPKMIATTNARHMREQVEDHHNHQTAHYQAIWEVADQLAVTVLGPAYDEAAS
jgi:hypothetical protein